MPQPARLLYVVALVCILGFVAACSDSSKDARPLPTSEPDARPFDTPAPGTPSPAREITGLFLGPKDTKVTKATLGAKPASTFRPSDGRSVVVYDTQTGKQEDLGPGALVSPVFNNGRMVYTADNKGWLVQLATLEKRDLGTANLVYFVDDTHVLLVAFGQRNILLDLNTGTRQLANSLSDTLVVDQETTGLGGPLHRRFVPGGYVLGYAVDVEKLYTLQCRLTPTPEAELCGRRFKEEYLLETDRGQRQFLFRAMQAAPAGKGEIVIATSPLCDDGNGKQVWCEEVLSKLEAGPGGRPGNIQYAKGTTNIFIVNIAGGQAKFIATAAYNPPTQLRPYNWPLAANELYVVWTENYCGRTRGNTRIYDRRTGQIKELDATLWVQLMGGMIGVGEFGARALLDPATLQYKTMLPDNLPDVYWSPDQHYAAVGQSSPHGGYCG